MVSEFPHELIRQVRISTRAAAGLSEYDPSDPSLPSLPSISAVIAASDSSLQQHRCDNCKGRLLRGSESIICLYCGRRPDCDVTPEPIGFTSSIGYKWFLRSLHLDGSEIVSLKNISEQDQGQSSATTASSLSELLNYKISRSTQKEKQLTISADMQLKESINSSSLLGVAPDEFFVKSIKTSHSSIPTEDEFFVKSSMDALSDISTEHLSINNRVGTPGGKDAAPDNLNLFQNVQSTKPTDSTVQHEIDEDFSAWEADFQFASSEIQQSGNKSSEQFVGQPVDSGCIIQDSKPVGNPPGEEVDLSTHIDSVFSSVQEVNEVKPTGNPAVSPAFGDWDSDDMWNNPNSNQSLFGDGFDATVDTKNHPSNIDHTVTSATDFFSSADFLQDLKLHPVRVDMTKNKNTNEEHEETGRESFEDWNDFMGIANAQTGLAESQHRVSTSDQKSMEIDLFSFDNKFEGEEFGSFSQPNLFSTAPLNSNTPAEDNFIMSEIPASNWSNTATSPALKEDTATDDKSTEDDVKGLISQMHDLSFMLETELSIPPADSENACNSTQKD